MSTSLFRKVALERLSSPEQLDQLIRVTSPRDWLFFSAIVLLLVAAVTWSLLGAIPTNITAPGLIVRPGGVQVINAATAGQVRKLHVKAGDKIDARAVVAIIFRPDADAANPFSYVFSPTAGRVLEVKVREGASVTPGTPVASIESQDVSLRAVLYVPLADGKKVATAFDRAQKDKKNLEVQLSPSNFKKEEFGCMLGRIASVAEFPSSRQAMMNVVQSETLVDRLGGSETPFEVWVDLTDDATTLGGYKWTSTKGDDEADVQQGTFCIATITVKEQTPISLVIPTLKEKTGL